MRLIRLAKETDFDGWRAAARTLRLAGVLPRKVAWTVAGSEVDLAFPEGRAPEDAAAGPPGVGEGAFKVPRAFAELAADVALHLAPDRFALLYRMLFRLAQNGRLMEDASDSDVIRARQMAAAVREATRRMVDEVVPRPIAGAAGVHIAWHAPAHRVAERAAPALTARYPHLAFSVLTPEVGLHWDMAVLRTGAGATLGDNPSEAALDDHWRKRCASFFPPAPVISSREMKAAIRGSRDGPYERGAPASLAEVAAGIDSCRRCDLWRGACRGLAGEGPPHAPVMLVGEQPADADDQAGRPFVGAAGALLDRALGEAGLDRGQVFLSNAIRHFKHERRGTRRLQRTPTLQEVEACRWWLDAERRLVQPKVVVALGATAAQAVFGKPLPVVSSRGEVRSLSGRARGLVTFHPAFVLRLPEERVRTETLAALVSDLRTARRLGEKTSGD